MSSVESILQKGIYTARINRTGVIQKFEMHVQWEKTNSGEYPYLFLDKVVPAGELVRLSQEAGLPIKTRNALVFPPGTTATYFTRYASWKH